MIQMEVKPDTRQRILDTAEKLFADLGLAVSIRHITAEAGVNLAAVHYHFRSKEALLDAVLLRRMAPVCEERMALLEAAERAHRPAPPSIGSVLHAFLAPTIRVGGRADGQTFVRMMGRIYAEQFIRVQALLERHFPEMVDRFKRAIIAAVPHLNQAEILYRIQFSAGAMAFAMLGARELERLSGGACPAEDIEGLTNRLVRFLAAGFMAPAGQEAHS